MKVVIASKNQGKLKEFLYLAQESNYEFTMLSESTSSPDETGNNFAHSHPHDEKPFPAQ